MPLSYNPSTNRILVTGYSTVTPCNFQDVYTADKAGVLSLHLRTGIVGVDGVSVGTDRAERPADYVVLGGASNDLGVIVTNWNGVTSTIRITGTDRDGVAQAEDVVVTGNGVYYTTKWFKTITHTQVTVFNGVTYDYELEQGQWGVTWKLSPRLYRIVGTSFMLGDAANDAYFGDIRKMVEIYDMPDMAFFFNSPVGKGHLYLGNVASVAEKTGKDGCVLQYHTTAMVMDQGFTKNLDEVYIYDTKVICDYTLATIFGLTGTSGRIWQSDITRSYLTGVAGNLDVYNLVIADGFLTLYGFSSTGPMSHIQGLNNTYAVWLPQTHVSTTIHNLYIRDYNIFGFIGSGTNVYHYLVDPDLDWSIATFNFYSSPLCRIYRQYTFDLYVGDKDGVGIDGATVKIWDKDNNLVVDTTTTAGTIPSHVVTRGYYDQDHGSTLVDASPHTIQVRKSGTNYLTIDGEFTLDSKKDWEITMVDVSDIVNAVNSIPAGVWNKALDDHQTRGTMGANQQHGVTSLNE